MTREAFIEKYRHVFGGMVLDAATAGLHGESLSLFVRSILRKVDAVLALQHADLIPDKPLNGTNHATPQAKTPPLAGRTPS